MRSSADDEVRLFLNHLKQKVVTVSGSVPGVGFSKVRGTVFDAKLSAFLVHTKEGDITLDLSHASIKRAALKPGRQELFGNCALNQMTFCGSQNLECIT